MITRHAASIARAALAFVLVWLPGCDVDESDIALDEVADAGAADDGSLDASQEPSPMDSGNTESMDAATDSSADAQP